MKKITKTLKAIVIAMVTGSFLVVPAFGFGNDPVSSYLTQGQPVGNWIPSVGNGLNYYIPIENQQAKTARKNLTVTPGNKNNEGDALHLKWRGRKVKNEWGGNALYDTTFSLGKSNANIDPVKDVAALVLDLKIIKAPNELTKISLQCNYSNKCTGEFPLKAPLRKLKKNTWVNFPIPLSCFNKSGKFDFSNLTNISIGTQGKLEIEIANIGLVALPEGSKGC